MFLGYKTRRFLLRLGIVVLVAVLLLTVALLLGCVWLRRFVVYTPQGAYVNMNLPASVPVGELPGKQERPNVPVVYPQQTQPQSPDQPAQQRLVGYYITAKQMETDLQTLRQQIAQLPAGTAIMLDVKSIWGYFFYTTHLGPGSSSFILAEIDAFIAELTASELYVIARLPALRDYEYAMNNTSSGLVTKKGYLWEDENNCFWLDPRDDGTLTYLIQIAKELRSLGFDEVMFRDFYVPTSSKIVFDTDRKEAMEAAAQTLVTACATDSYTVSFLGYIPELTIPQGNCRLYLTGVSAADVQDVLELVTVTDILTQLVFLAETNDTRYDVSGTLRPLELAH